MSDKNQNSKKCFYSWQSDLPNKDNRSFIEKCLGDAKKKLANKTPGIKIEIDDATRGTTGSPHISETILHKISTSDLFVGDVTTVTLPTANRQSANPNVLFETGYAVGSIGWDRVVLVFNSDHGSFPSDLPFDIDKRLVTQFSSSAYGAQSSLTGQLARKIQSILQQDPARPSPKVRQDIERRRDVAQVEEICSTFDISTIQKHCGDVQCGRISDRTLDYFTVFEHTFKNLNYHIYDSETATIIQDFYDAWDNAMPDPRYTEHANQGYKFRVRGSIMDNEEAIEWKRLQNSWQPLYQSLKNLIDHIRNKYYEVDLNECSKRARSVPSES